MSKLSFLDFGFFIAETAASPKHVAGLLICKRPVKSTAAFARNLYLEYLTHTDLKAPFNQIIEFSFKGMPNWRKADTMNLSEH
ncbi:MAG: hypothetical protein ACOYMG_26525, partial [Candidatus Methylumidiphilus sp.]